MNGTASAPCMLRFLMLYPVPPPSAAAATITMMITGQVMTHVPPPPMLAAHVAVYEHSLDVTWPGAGSLPEVIVRVNVFLHPYVYV